MTSAPARIVWAALVPAALLLWAKLAQAAEKVADHATQATAPAMPAVPPPPGDFSWGGYFQAIGLMFFFLGAVWAVVWWMRRSGRFPRMIRPGSMPRDALFLEGQLSLGPRKGLMVVRFLNKRVLLGVTDQRITLLSETELDHEFSFSEYMAAQEQQAAPDSGKADDARREL